MRKVKEFAKELGAPIIALALPLFALAVAEPPTGVMPNSSIQATGDVTAVICAVVDWIFYLLIIAAVVFVLIAAFRYLTAAGDPEKVKKAGATLLYAAIAVVIALVARGIPLIAASFLGGTVTVGC